MAVFCHPNQKCEGEVEDENQEEDAEEIHQKIKSADNKHHQESGNITTHQSSELNPVTNQRTSNDVTISIESCQSWKQKENTFIKAMNSGY